MFKISLLSIVNMFSFFANMSVAKSSKKYPNLVENNVTSENYEIVKLIDGQIGAIFYNPDKQQVVVDAGQHLWKIDEHGQLIDTIEGYLQWYSSGYYFNPDYYLDWIDTGDKQKKSYTQIIDGNAYSEKQLFTLFKQAVTVEFGVTANNAYAYLLSKNNSSVIDISNKREMISYSCGDDSYRDLRWNQTCIEGYTKPYQDSIGLLESSLHGSREDEDPLSPLTVQGFKKRNYYFEEGLLAQLWIPFVIPFFGGKLSDLPDRYWFGDAVIDLKHNNETLSFRVFSDKQEKDERNKRIVNFDNFTIYDFPEQPDLKILKLSYLPYRFSGTERHLNDYYEDNVGLYVLRKKTHASPVVEHPQPWFINVAGLEAKRKIWGHINFVDPKINQQFYQLGVRGKHPDLVLHSVAAAPQAFYYFPESFTVNVQTKKYRSVFKLQVSQQKTAWFHNPLGYTELPLTIKLDQQELKSAVDQLVAGQPKYKAKSVLNLQVHFEEVTDGSSTLAVAVELAGKSVQLTGFNVDYPMQSSVKIEREKLKLIHTAVVNNEQSLQTLFSHIQQLSGTPEFSERYIPYVAQYMAEQINKHNLAGEFVGTLKLLTFYVDHVLPFINQQTAESSVLYNHTVIASQSLVAAIHNKQESMAALVFGALLGPDFDITTQENGTLVYNLAAYYALEGNKDELLIASKHSRRLGKPAEQFIKDDDFKRYLQDAQFLEIINTKYE